MALDREIHTPNGINATSIVINESQYSERFLWYIGAVDILCQEAL